MSGIVIRLRNEPKMKAFHYKFFGGIALLFAALWGGALALRGTTYKDWFEFPLTMTFVFIWMAGVILAVNGSYDWAHQGEKQ